MNWLDLLSGLTLGVAGGWWTRTKVYHVQRKVRHVHREARHIHNWLAFGVGVALVAIIGLVLLWQTFARGILG